MIQYDNDVIIWLKDKENKNKEFSENVIRLNNKLQRIYTFVMISLISLIIVLGVLLK